MTDNRMLVATIVGTGIAMTTVIVAFVAIIAGGTNDRIDDVNANVNNRINDVNRRIDDMNTNLNRQIDDLRQEMRELRTLVIDAIKGPDPTADE